ncbi:MAG TPA: hypothetical protein VMU06_20840 [Stellaceae bacterium]|nr:hypothetical protein [Stellaceae bacterium]
MSGAAAHAAASPRLCFFRTLPAPIRAYLLDDIKFLVGWTFDAAALNPTLRAGDVVDARSGFARLPSFSLAGATPMVALRGKYRVMQLAFDRGRGYYGIEFGVLDERGEVAAVLLANRLFRMPIALRDPGGLATDVLTNAAMMLGFSTAALEDAEAAARMAYEDARRLGVPLLIGGQSQAGGTAQLQIATLQKAGASDASAGFVTLNAADALRSIRRLGLAGEEVEGINFAKDLDPGVGPKAPFRNRVGFQVYIHRDGSGGREPGDTSFLDALLHPRQHFLDSFNQVDLTAALAAALAEAVEGAAC